MLTLTRSSSPLLPSLSLYSILVVSGGGEATGEGCGGEGVAAYRGRRLHGPGGETVAGGQSQMEGGEKRKDLLVYGCGTKGT